MKLSLKYLILFFNFFYNGIGRIRPIGREWNKEQANPRELMNDLHDFKLGTNDENGCIS